MLLTNSLTGRQIGAQGTAVQVDRIVTDWTSMPARETGEPLDFAITGDGFFAVRTEQGVRYTRNGQFSVSPQGQLTTASGDPVLGRGGQPVTVGADGRVDPRRLEVVTLQNPRKDGDSLVLGTPGGGGAAGTARAGAPEGSGAEPARSMVDMIASLRAFEAGQRVITTIDETLAKASQLGSLQSASPARRATVQLPYHGGMATRTRRIEMRADPASEERIARAAQARDLSVSAFVLAAATREADRVLGRADQTMMPAAQFDALIRALEDGDAAPRLDRAARGSRAFRRA